MHYKRMTELAHVFVHNTIVAFLFLILSSGVISPIPFARIIPPYNYLFRIRSLLSVLELSPRITICLFRIRSLLSVLELSPRITICLFRIRSLLSVLELSPRICLFRIRSLLSVFRVARSQTCTFSVKMTSLFSLLPVFPYSFFFF